MSHFGPDQAIGLSALVAGLLIIGGGLYARRGDRLNTRQGAKVLAGTAAFTGIVSMLAGAVWLIQSA
ncbi:hypothetical protein GCM10023264_12080 [Sphingomonas daechungensis]|uniref:hypothetical protein n=1 Tax=Sphingomonas daechungensis TaxID=1176646 RepID=UPI0031E9F4E6